MEGRCYFLTDITAALDVEYRPWVGNLIGQEGEGVFLPVVDSVGILIWDILRVETFLGLQAQ
jgi:hypothetical protein